MKFLLIQRRSLGDALFTATVAEVLKKEFPDAEVHLLTLPFAVDFFEKYLYLDKVFPYSGFFKTLRELRQRDYDVILDYEATFRTYPLVFFSKAKRKLAFYRNSREARLGFIYTDLVRAENFGFTFWDRLKLLKPLGVDYKKYIDRRFKPSFPTRDLPNVELPFEDYIVFSPKGLLRNKTISPEKVIEIASALERKLSKRVVISVEPREKGYIESLKRQMNK
jgi:heptosyltransferase-2